MNTMIVYFPLFNSRTNYWLYIRIVLIVRYAYVYLNIYSTRIENAQYEWICNYRAYQRNDIEFIRTWNDCAIQCCNLDGLGVTNRGLPGPRAIARRSKICCSETIHLGRAHTGVDYSHGDSISAAVHLNIHESLFWGDATRAHELMLSMGPVSTASIPISSIIAELNRHNRTELMRFAEWLRESEWSRKRFIATGIRWPLRRIDAILDYSWR